MKVGASRWPTSAPRSPPNALASAAGTRAKRVAPSAASQGWAARAPAARASLRGWGSGSIILGTMPEDLVEATETQPTSGKLEEPQPEALPWEVGEVVRCGWHAFRRSWGVLGISAALLAWLPELPEELAELGSDADAATVLLRERVALVMSGLLGLWLQAGAIRLWLTVARGQKPRLRQILIAPARLPALLGVYVLYAISMAAGVFALGIGFFVAFVAFMFAAHFVVDARMGPIAAMKASWQLTRGKRLWLLLLALPGTAFGWGGIQVSFPGSSILMAVVVAPVLGVAGAIAFLRMSGRGALRAALPSPEGIGPAAYRELAAAE